MPFSEYLKLEAKRKSDFQCCICKEAFVEVHHIVPQAAGGLDDLDNAAPLCASCHDRFGGNTDKRKQIREMRDLWWEVCADRKRSPSLLEFNRRLDQIQSGVAATQATQADSAATLEELKAAFIAYSESAVRSVSSAASLTQFAAASGISLPQALSGFSFDDRCPRCSSSNTKLLNYTDGYAGELRECLECHFQFQLSQTY